MYKSKRGSVTTTENDGNETGRRTSEDVYKSEADMAMNEIDVV